MKKLLKILGWILGLLILFLLAGFLLPAKVSVSRSATIAASGDKVYSVLNDLKTYNSWMTWNQKDPQMKIEWGPRTSGQGAYYKWTSSHKQVGSGQLSITEAQPNKKITTALIFGASPDPSYATWNIEPSDKDTKLQWTMDMDMGANPIGRWMGFLMKGAIEKDFDQSLSQLKEKIESGKLGQQTPRMQLEETKLEAMQLLTILDTAQAMTDIGPLLQKAYGEMGDVLKTQNLSMSGAPMAWYYTESEPFVVDAAIPVSAKPRAAGGRIKLRDLPAGPAVVVHYYGPYEESGAAYEKIREWITAQGKKAKGAPFEVYMDDPTTKSSMYEVRTDIIQPLQ